MTTTTDENAAAPLRVLIVDDHHLVRSGFSMMLSIEDDLEVVGDADNGARAIEVARATRPDVVLMDVQMPVLDGIEATRTIVAEDLGKVVILTTFDRDDYVFDGLAAGASGFLLKNSEPEQLIEAVRAVGRGHALLAPEVTRRVIAAMTSGQGGSPGSGMPPSGQASPGQVVGGATAGSAPSKAAAVGRVSAGEVAALAQLTEREREVLTLVSRGMSNAEIARELFLGEATIKTHVSNTLAKLHLRDRVQAVVFAFENGLAGGD